MCRAQVLGSISMRKQRWNFQPHLRRWSFQWREGEVSLLNPDENSWRSLLSKSADPSKCFIFYIITIKFQLPALAAVIPPYKVVARQLLVRFPETAATGSTVLRQVLLAIVSYLGRVGSAAWCSQQWIYRPSFMCYLFCLLIISSSLNWPVR